MYISGYEAIFEFTNVLISRQEQRIMAKLITSILAAVLVLQAASAPLAKLGEDTYGYYLDVQSVV
ncbi:hypothetical protein BC938DRAFT_473181 [Jimgerdemannia flammicorona]|uniref:Uncharacterized protein n=1 Tax=Jimgerdemannia flammicorona TaxID=994334 RepID=A0A433Q4R0_9FUNG|nr:hypothetical protein BC938DRAFT_473181 [Jimgerdemannia flammicorona]